MIPRYRAWLKKEKRLILSEDVLAIDYDNKEIVTQKIYSEYGLPVERDIYSHDFDDVNLMQSTGLLDKNGKEIFEGDVVKMAKNIYSDPTYYEVVRHLDGAYRLESEQHGCQLWLRHTDCEIAGNIYKNPELVEVSS